VPRRGVVHHLRAASHRHRATSHGAHIWGVRSGHITSH
jgi:hypothetical protein